MENRILPAALIVAAVFPVIGPAKDKDPYEAWLDDEAQWLLTREEEKQWDKLSTPVEKDAFEALFWARRDPTPGTARNEFREEYARRLAYADGHFGTARQQGRKSDRGRVYCLLGAPTRESTYNLRSEGEPAGREPGVARRR
ncbi:MAG: GWxTD domain-containing protein [Acidobacteriota bacterium]